MTTADRWYASNTMVQEPPIPCSFKPGDMVRFTNEAGIEFGPHKVLGYAKPEDMVGNRFIHIDYDCVWFPCSPESLSHWTS